MWACAGRTPHASPSLCACVAPPQHPPAAPCAAACPSWNAVSPSRFTTSPPSDTSISRDVDTCGGNGNFNAERFLFLSRLGVVKRRALGLCGWRSTRTRLRGLEQALKALLDDVQRDEHQADAVGEAGEHLPPETKSMVGSTACQRPLKRCSWQCVRRRVYFVTATPRLCSVRSGIDRPAPGAPPADR